jgi:cellulose synthase/poly-beta-1,6-N-acetylglucosamine synthase-like glycosyltransferase
MGDSICFRADILRDIGWGKGLTEDYQLRQKFLLRGIAIDYEPAAKGYGEATLTWEQAKAQRARWLRGTYDAGQQFAGQLLREGIKHRNWLQLDGALQVYVPAYSTLTLVSGGLLALQLLLNVLVEPVFPTWLLVAWASVVAVLFVYPLFGLALERAPVKAYVAILSGPLFIVWRTWLALKSRYGQTKIVWVRTQHGPQNES